ncbi:MAG: DEAD/DEAH box helicase family protein, partial [Eubacteriales bacterium]|nr:DEAD/DEAH box helicase family protein [Eubacteriales bacterium]
MQNGIEKNDFGTGATEWFYFNGTPERAEKLTDEFININYSEVQVKEKFEYKLREEQDSAVKKTLEYFNSNEYKKEFLWNCKPRFGKTLTTYDFILKSNANKVLLVTNRPAISNSWYDDFEKF